MAMVMRQRKLLIQLFMAKPYHTIALLAYNNHELTLKNIQHLINNGYKNNILLFDNGSSPSFKKMLITMVFVIKESLIIFMLILLGTLL